VLPPIAVVVGVPEQIADLRDGIQSSVHLVAQMQLVQRIRLAVLNPVDVKRMQVVVPPTHGVLENPMHSVEGVAARDQHPSPHLGTHCVEGDPELEDLSGHATILDVAGGPSHA
jgi:hypothetical protein